MLLQPKPSRTGKKCKGSPKFQRIINALKDQESLPGLMGHFDTKGCILIAKKNLATLFHDYV